MGAVSPGLWPRWALEAPAGSLSQAQAGWHSALAALLKTGVGRGGGGGLGGEVWWLGSKPRAGLCAACAEHSS